MAHVAGVRIRVHWSVLVIFGIIVVALAVSRFPVTYPGRSPLAYAAAGLASAVIFFLSLLVHELAHAIVARRNGLPVDDIVLWLLGGVAKLRTEASNPGAELRIAGVGPLVSLLLGGFFAACAWVLDLVSVPRMVIEVVVWLAGINILLAVFNSVPAAPLDGGRLLRAFLWWRTGDRLRATRGATAAGRAFGWLLIVLGLATFASGGGFGGLWLTFIGWFLVAAATAEGRQAQVREVLAGVPVREAMTPQPMTVPDGLTIADFLAGPSFRYRHSAFPVLTDDGRPAGLLTLGQAREVAPVRREDTRIRDVMLPLDRVTVVSPSDPLTDLLPRMEPGAEHRALVLANGRVAGIVSSSDVSRVVNWLTSAPPRSAGR